MLTRDDATKTVISWLTNGGESLYLDARDAANTGSGASDMRDFVDALDEVATVQAAGGMLAEIVSDYLHLVHWDEVYDACRTADDGDDGDDDDDEDDDEGL